MSANEKTHTQITLDKDLHRELKIAAVLQSISMVDVVRDAFKDYKNKYRLDDRVREFKR